MKTTLEIEPEGSEEFSPRLSAAKPGGMVGASGRTRSNIRLELS
jgi:hypothetical protein